MFFFFVFFCSLKFNSWKTVEWATTVSYHCERKILFSRWDNWGVGRVTPQLMDLFYWLQTVSQLKALIYKCGGWVLIYNDIYSPIKADTFLYHFFFFFKLCIILRNTTLKKLLMTALIVFLSAARMKLTKKKKRINKILKARFRKSVFWKVTNI